MATTTIRIDIDTLPDHFDRCRPNMVADAIKTALREGGIRADCSDLFSHIKIDLPTAQLAAASAMLSSPPRGRPIVSAHATTPPPCCARSPIWNTTTMAM